MTYRVIDLLQRVATPFLKGLSILLLVAWLLSARGSQPVLSQEISHTKAGRQHIAAALLITSP